MNTDKPNKEGNSAASPATGVDVVTPEQNRVPIAAVTPSPPSAAVTRIDAFASFPPPPTLLTVLRPDTGESSPLRSATAAVTTTFVAITPSPAAKAAATTATVEMSEDFAKLFSLLGLSFTNSAPEAVEARRKVALVFQEAGISEFDDLLFVQMPEEIEAAETHSLLHPILQRKLYSVIDFLQYGQSLDDISSMNDVYAFHQQQQRQQQQLEVFDATHPNTNSTTANANESGTNNNIINLDVGGFKFVTSRETLSSVPGSYFDSLVSGRHPVPAQCNKDGHLFIDRNGRLFEHILDFLRVKGNVVSPLPTLEADREALVVEADFYGLDGLVRAIRLPHLDISEYLGKKTLQIRQTETALREDFMANKPVTDPYKGLVPLFCPDNGVYTLPLTYNPDESKGDTLMGKLRVSKKSGVPVTVKKMSDFRSNFNRKHANVLHRLEEVLLQEPIIIAGGAVLEALVGGDTRTSKWWTGTSDVDLFVCTQDPVEATRIAKRAFEALAVIGETWVIMRSRGVITLHSWIDHGDFGEKIQIILRLYASPTEVLVGFDCDCCCCAFDGREVWAAPRCIEALQKGVNIVNSIHSWPNKASYELRLAKYASRGFPVAVPGLESNRIDYDNIFRTKLLSLKGLARLLKVSFCVETSFGEENGALSLPVHIAELRRDAIEILDPCEDAMRASGYVDNLDGIIMPTEYCDGEGPRYYLWYPGSENDFFPILTDPMRSAVWRQIEEADEENPDGIPRLLNDAWDQTKRSREYLNANMDKDDLDNMYYDHAYKK